VASGAPRKFLNPDEAILAIFMVSKYLIRAGVSLNMLTFLLELE
jgi:hypothetical protein